MRTLAVLLVALTTGACASSGAVPRPFPGSTTGGGLEAPPPNADDRSLAVPSAVVSTALQYLGTPYRNGGTDPTGFDCSGFVQFVFARHGNRLPRDVRAQYAVGDEVDLADVAPGDLLFFETISPGASHVGVAVGEGRFVHAPSSRGVVRVEPYTAVYWARRFVGARRISAGTFSTADAGALRRDRPSSE